MARGLNENLNLLVLHSSFLLHSRTFRCASQEPAFRSAGCSGHHGCCTAKLSVSAGFIIALAAHGKLTTNLLCHGFVISFIIRSC